MISLMNVYCARGSGNATVILADNVSLTIAPRDRIGVLGLPGSGKSTLARIIAGQERPDRGLVHRTGRISWQMGYSAGFHPALSGAQNVAHFARLWHLDPIELSAKVADFSQAGPAYFSPIGQIAPGIKSNIALALSLSCDFDYYLADDMNVSANPHFREKCEAALHDRLESAGLIMFSRHPRMITAFCHRYFVLSEGTLIECATSEEAADILSLLSAKEADAHVYA